jgi:hypothetical protein
MDVDVLPDIVVCFERERLLLEFTHAVSEFNAMQSAQVTAVIRGEESPFHGAALKRAADARETCKYAIIFHRQGHG